MEREENWPEPVMLSALAHYSYCPRRCSLIHVEGIFEDNLFTLRGSMAHVRADEPSETTEAGVRIERALPVWSENYGLYGRADVVEFLPDGSVCPVEYKHGRKRRSEHDELQLCAQAICLEEMLGRPVISGAVYSSSTHQRRDVEFTDDLRRKTLETIESVRRMLAAGEVPEPADDARCPNCSLVHACMPSGVTGFAMLSVADSVFAASDSEVVE